MTNTKFQLSTVKLAYSFLNSSREDFIRECTKGSFKASLKGKTPEEAYGKALMKLNIHSLFNEESLPPETVAYYYLNLLVSNGCPLSKSEKAMYDNLKDKTTVTCEATLLPTNTFIQGHNITHDVWYKTIIAAKYVFSLFCKLDGAYDDFADNRITPEEFTERIKNFLLNSIDIVLEDTNIAYTFDTRGRMKVYLPKDVGFEDGKPIDFLLNMVIQECNGGWQKGIPIELYKNMLNLVCSDTSIYTFFSDPTAVYNICCADVESRILRFDTINAYLKPVFTLGEMHSEKLANGTSLTLIGSYTGKVVVFVNNNISFVIDKEVYGMAYKQLSKYKACSTNKVVCVMKGEERVKLWDLIFTNAVPQNGDFNYISRKNIS